MTERQLQELLDREKRRWLLWKYEDWREMIEATIDDEDGELFFYLTEFGGEAFPVEVVCTPWPEQILEVTVIITIEPEVREAEVTWEIDSEDRVEVVVETTDREEDEDDGVE